MVTNKKLIIILDSSLLRNSLCEVVASIKYGMGSTPKFSYIPAGHIESPLSPKPEPALDMSNYH